MAVSQAPSGAGFGGHIDGDQRRGPTKKESK
jgi:hypothetical protein